MAFIADTRMRTNPKSEWFKNVVFIQEIREWNTILRYCFQSIYLFIMLIALHQFRLPDGNIILISFNLHARLQHKCIVLIELRGFSLRNHLSMVGSFQCQ